MNIQGIIFDVNGTLIDIQTDEGREDIYRAISHFLTYQGISARRGEVRDEYFRIMDEQRKASGEEYPEFDTVGVWREFLLRRWGGRPAVSQAKARQMALFLAEMFRGISRNRLQLYPGVREVLDELAPRYTLAALSDAQTPWALPEMRAVGIADFFDPVVISGNLGFRKPDRRIFALTLRRMRLEPEDVLFVGNDMYRDVYGAKQMGMRTVFFSSNQGRKQMDGVEPDYIICQFPELRQAISFFAGQ
ncbi:MAG: HAD family hydrolase [Thermodesulfobacteriota bacterium]